MKALAGGEYAIEKIHLDQNKPMVYLMTGDKKRDGGSIDVVVLEETGKAKTVRLDMDGLREFTEAAL